MADEEQLAILRQGVEVWNAWRCAAMRLDATFGNLGNHDELAALIDPRHAELAELEHELSRLTLYQDLTWTAAGPVIRLGRHEVVASPGAHARIASDLAMAVLTTARVAAAEAA